MLKSIKYRWFIALVLLTVALTAMAGCGGQAGEAPEGETPESAAGGGDVSEGMTEGEDEMEWGEPIPEGEDPIRVVMLIIQPFGSPFEGDLWQGIVKAKEDGWASEIKLIEFKSPEEYEEGVRAVSEEYDLVIGTFELLKPAFETVAPDYPDTKYVNVWVQAPEPEEDYPNVRGYVYNVEHGSYINGVIAARMCGDHVGFVGGDDNAVILRFFAGFEAGLKATNPDIELSPAWAGDFNDPVKGRELGIRLFQEGAECIMTAANKTGLGVIVAGQEVGKPIFGVDVDQSVDAPDTVISSALANADFSGYQSIKDVVLDQWSGGTVYLGSDDGVSMVAINEDWRDGIPQDVLQEAEEVEAKIASGEIEVPETTDTR